LLITIDLGGTDLFGPRVGFYIPARTDKKINPALAARRFMNPPFLYYVRLAKRRTTDRKVYPPRRTAFHELPMRPLASPGLTARNESFVNVGFGSEPVIRLFFAAARQEKTGLCRTTAPGQEPTFADPLFDHPVGATAPWRLCHLASRIGKKRGS
jgi:hypothetical protein